MVHEMVHCWQRNAHGTAPGGLIEGIADWVRLKAGLVPPHWKREADVGALTIPGNRKFSILTLLTPDRVTGTLAISIRGIFWIILKDASGMGLLLKSMQL